MSNYNRFIDSLITGTKEKSITWSYLDENRLLYEKFVSSKDDFSTDDSFWATYDDAYFVLISMQEEDSSDSADINFLLTSSTRPIVDVIKLAVVPPTFRDIKIISSLDNKNYRTSLIRLKNLIKKDFPNSDDIIEKFISENPALPF